MPSSTNCSNRLPLAAFAALLVVGGCVQKGAVPAGPGPAPVRIAVLPVEDLSGAGAPAGEVRRSLITGLRKRGVAVLEEEQVEAFLTKNRIRYIAGIEESSAQAWKEQAGADAVLITSCELYSRSEVPKVFLTSRLVATGRAPEVLWMDSAGFSGDDTAGILGIGLVSEISAVADTAVDLLSRSLARFLSGERRPAPPAGSGLGPEIVFRSSTAGLDLRENTVSFLLRSSRLDERKGSARIPVVLNARTAKPVQVDFAASGRTVRGKGAVATLRAGTLIFAPGETVRSIELAIAKGTLLEGERSVEVALRDPRNAALGGPAVHVVEIADMPPATVNLAPAARSAPKEIGNMTLAVELTAGAAQDVTVPFTVSGTAAEGPGYRQVTPSPLVIKAGELSAGITIAVGDGERHGPDRTLEVTLQTPVNALLGPHRVVRLTIEDRSGRPKVAVLPFFNESTRRNAGEILMLQFVKELRMQDRFEVIEPGLVRQHLLNMRTVMDRGASIADAGPIFTELNADLILSGRIMDFEYFEQSAAAPKVDLSVEMIERRSGKVVWSAKSHHRGDEKVLLFDWGRIKTANALAEHMVRALVGKMAEE